jgi:hypothetical protein
MSGKGDLEIYIADRAPSRRYLVLEFLGLNRVLKAGAKSSTARMWRFQMRFYVRCDDSIQNKYQV